METSTLLHFYTSTLFPKPHGLFRCSLLIALFVGVCALVQAQSAYCGDYYPCYSTLELNDLENLPIIYIKVDFHFKEQADTINNVPVLVNFHCGNPNDPYYAPDYVASILDSANAMLSNPEQSNQTSAADMPDTRIRLVLIDGDEDPCESIFIYDSSTPFSYSNPDALHIRVQNSDQSGFSGSYHAGTQLIDLNNIHEGVFVLGYTIGQVGPAGRVLTHEIGHYAGLCHSFSYENTCHEIDPVDECSSDPDPTLPICGSNCSDCCVWGYSNNLMSYGAQTALTFSQWVDFYHNLTVDEDVVVIDGSIEEAMEELCGCVDPEPQQPLEIEESTIEFWDSPRFVETDIEIRAGAVLVITSWLAMAKDKKIIVNRGGRLFVQNGRIFGQSPDCRWGGILVHGNSSVTQPNRDNAQSTDYELTSDSSGVVWLKDAEIHWAHTAISTKGTGTLSSSAYFGGLVMIDNTDFYDNGRAIEFMRYDYSNKSYLDICFIYSSNENPELSSQGVSIWACKDISFRNVYFEGLGSYGIFGINYSADIQVCGFDGGTSSVSTTTRTGIQSENTMPNSVTGEITVDSCTFKNYRRDIYALSTPNLINRFTITNSTFEEPIGSSPFTWGVRLIGESAFSIGANNVFIDKGWHVQVVSSGRLPNDISCNYFQNNRDLSIWIQGQNDRLTFLGNEFNDPTPIRQVLLSSSAGITTIAERIGFVNNSAGNCFFYNQDGAIQASQSNTRVFDYYVYDLEGDPKECEVPEDNLSDSGDNNYYLWNSFVPYECQTSAPIQFAEEDLAQARDSTLNKGQLYEGDPTPENYYAYLDAIAHQDTILRFLVSNAYVSNDFNKADSLMLGESDVAYIRAVVGQRTQRGDIAGADSILQTIPLITEDDERFAFLMSINFEIYSSDTLYRLTTQEEDELYEIVNAIDSSIMSGYACALLNLCLGYTCDFEIDTTESFAAHPDLSQLPSQRKQQIENSTIDGLHIYPNPVNEGAAIHLPDSQEGSIRIDIFDTSGKRIFTNSYSDQYQVNMDNLSLPPGVYFVRISKDNTILQNEKLIVFD